MQFQVPQFIEIEDKIFGPLTLKQFLYLAGGAGACVALFIYIPYKIVAILLIIPIASFSLALAFYKINNRPFIEVVQSYFYYSLGSKLYLWKKAEKKPVSQLADQVEQVKSMLSVPKMSESKLKDITWSLDIKQNLNPLTREDNKNK
ncbi:MAG: PrgI family protein [Patescibacteria group bacterium]